MTRTRIPRHKQRYEVYQLAVEDWSFGYGLRVNPDGRARDHLPVCWEYPSVTVTGPLISRTKRRIERVALDFRPDGFGPKEWKPELRSVGVVLRVRRRVLSASVSIPPDAYQTLVLALGSKKVPGLEFVAHEIDGRGGMITSVGTMDPTDPEAIV